MGLNEYKKWHKEFKKAEKNTARAGSAEKQKEDPEAALPAHRLSAELEEELRKRQANEHIAPIDPDDEE